MYHVGASMAATARSNNLDCPVSSTGVHVQAAPPPRPPSPAGPPGPRPDRLLEGDGITQPLLVLWGDGDPFTPANGPVGRQEEGQAERGQTRTRHAPGTALLQT